MILYSIKREKIKIPLISCPAKDLSLRLQGGREFLAGGERAARAAVELALASGVFHNYQLQEATKLATISTSSSGAIGLDT